MSFMRCGYPLRYFKKGETEYYVFPGEYKGKEYIEDYSSDYKDDKSFAELIGNFVKSATGNEEYAFKIVKVLAKKLGIEKELRKNPLTVDEWFENAFKHNGSTLPKFGFKKGGAKNEKKAKP